MYSGDYKYQNVEKFLLQSRFHSHEIIIDTKQNDMILTFDTEYTARCHKSRNGTARRRLNE